MKRRSDLALYVRLLQIARPYAWHIVGLFILSLLSTPIALIAPLPLKIVVDHVIGSEPVPSFLHWLGTDSRRLLVVAVTLLVGVNVTKHLVSLGRNLLSAFTGERLVQGFRQKLFEHAQRLSLVYHDRRGTADAIYRIQSDAAAIRTVALEGVTPFITSVLTVLGMLLVTAAISPQLALIALTVVPALLFVTNVYRRSMRDQWREVKTHESGALAVVQEVLGALRLVKAFGQEEREGKRFERRAVQGLRARLRVVASQGTFTTALGLITTAGTAAVLYVGVRGIQASVITLGDLLLVMAYLGQLYDPLSTMGQKVAGLQNAFASAERAFELFDLDPDVPESLGAVHLDRAEGSLRFEDVWFAYSAGSDILRGANLDVPAGSTVGIMGLTGAGKTTLVSLIARFYDPTQGRVLLDGRDLRDYPLRDVRKQLAIVLQEPVLFSTSIRENIEYGRPGARTDAVIAAAKAANIHEFIDALPAGYETVVGERGMRLSGGERQRIALARAFLRDAPILILDEPTSSVDVKTEAGIVEAMQRLMDGRTTFMIAHRLGTLEHCDLLLMIRDGRVHEIARGSTDDAAAALQHSVVLDHGRVST